MVLTVPSESQDEELGCCLVPKLLFLIIILTFGLRAALQLQSHTALLEDCFLRKRQEATFLHSEKCPQS